MVRASRPLLLALCAGLFCLAVALIMCSRGSVQPPATPAEPPPDPARHASPGHGWTPVEADPSASPASGAVWWEAEKPKHTNFPDAHPFSPARGDEAAALSGGDWIGTDEKHGRLFLEYGVDAPGADTFTLYARKFWQHGPFRWRFDDQEWRRCGRDVVLLDSVTLRKFVSANWVELGSVQLSAGRHELRIELEPDAGVAAFDAFVLSSGSFVPRGKLKPNDEYPPAPAGWFNFAPRGDTFRDSAIDLRRLNQKRAGADGFVRVKGDHLVFEASQRRVRFWGANAGHDVLALPETGQRRYARWLAKLGVNLVRLQGSVVSREDVRRVDESKVQKIQALATVLSEEGIYLGLSIYFPLSFSLTAGDGFPDYDGKPPFALSYISDAFEAVQKGWWASLLGNVDPATGVALKDNPALAYVELVNEDSTLFWTFKPNETIPKPLTRKLERRFAEWVRAKHGSLQAALEAWDDEQPEDAVREGRLSLLPLWHIKKERDPRSRDTAEFLTELMRKHYQRMAAHIKTELGYRGLVVCSNWETADERILGPLDNWANTECDVMDRHGYFSGRHEGDASSYAVRPGQKYDDRSALRFETTPAPSEAHPGLELPVVEPRYNGKPSFVSEVGWPWPNRFRAEAPLLAAAYASLHGVDGVMFFATDQPRWATTLAKFETADPMIMGQYPAAALLYRALLVREAPAVSRVRLSRGQMLSLEGAPLWTPASLDTLRTRDVPRGQLVEVDELKTLDPLSLLVGPIDFELGGSPENSSLADLSPFIHKARHTVTSSTRELSWDYGQGLVTIEAPQVNAALGFLGSARHIELGAVSFDFALDYGALCLIALDGQPLERSRKMLLQVATEAKNTGFKAEGTGLRIIEEPGTAPILVRNPVGQVTLKRPDANQFEVIALDFNGYPALRSTSSARRIELHPATLHYLLVRR